MARDVNGTTQFFRSDAAVFLDYPFTVAGWFWPDVAHTGCLFSIGDKDNNTEHIMMRCNTAGQFLFRLVTGGTPNDAQTTNTYTTGAWNHFFARGVADDDRRASLNNGTEDSDNTTAGLVGYDRTALGIRAALTNAVFFNGRLAEIAVWDQDIHTTAIQTALFNGICPLLIRPDRLVAYWPLIGGASDLNALDIVGSLNLAAAASPPAIAHPRMYYPSALDILHVPAAAGDGSDLLFARQHLSMP